MSEEKIETREDRIEKVLKEEEALENSFKDIFPKYNDFNMPVNVAWQIFGKIVRERGISITSSDTQKIISLCIDVKKDYYENERGMITDGNGNPDIKANLSEDGKFLEKNLDLRIVVETKATEDRIKNIIEEKSFNIFIEKFYSLSDAEKNITIRGIIHNYCGNEQGKIRNKLAEEKTYEDIKQGRKISAEAKESMIRDQVLYELENYIEIPEKRVDCIKNLSFLIKNLKPDDEETKKFIIATLTDLGMDPKDIYALERSQSEFERIYLNFVSGNVKGTYESLNQIIDERAEMLFHGRLDRLDRENIEYYLDENIDNIENRSNCIKAISVLLHDLDKYDVYTKHIIHTSLQKLGMDSKDLYYLDKDIDTFQERYLEFANRETNRNYEDVEKIREEVSTTILVKDNRKIAENSTWQFLLENIGDDEKELDCIKAFSILIDNYKNQSDETKQKVQTILLNLGMNPRDIRFLERNQSEFERRYLNFINDKTLECYQSIDEIQDEMSFKIPKKSFKDFDKIDIDNADVLKYFEENFQNSDKELSCIKYISILLDNLDENDNYSKQSISKLLSYLGMNSEDISILFRNKGEFCERYIEFINQKSGNKYKNIGDIKKESTEELLTYYTSDEVVDRIIGKSEKNKREVKHVEDSLTREQLKIYRQLKDIGFYKEENAILLIKILIDLEDGKHNPVSMTGIGEKRREDLKIVLEKMILDPKNAGKFGYYIDVDDDNNRYISRKRVKENITKFETEYERLADDVKIFVNDPTKDFSKTFQAIEDSRTAKLNSKEIIEEYLRDKEKFDSLEKSPEKEELRQRLAKTMRSMHRFRSFSAFIENGKINPDAVKKFYDQVYANPEHNEEFDTVVYRFIAIDNPTKTKEENEKNKKEVFEAFGGYKVKDASGNEISISYEEMHQKYIEYMEKGALNTAITTIYSAYLNRRNIDSMKTTDKAFYMNALGFLYNNKDPKVKAFAETFIKFNFPGIPLDKNGNVDSKSFDKIFKAYHTGRFEGKIAKDATELYLKNFTKSVRDSIINLHQTVFDIDIDSINRSVEGIQKDDSDFDILYNSEEKQIVDAIRSTVKLDKKIDIQKLVSIRKALMRDINFMKTQKAQENDKESDEENDKENEETIRRYTVIAETIKKFALSSQNRMYFHEYINSNDLTAAMIRKVDPKIAEALGYEVKDKNQKLDKEAYQKPKLEKNRTAPKIKRVLESIFMYNGENFSEIEDRLKELEEELGSEQIFILFKKSDGTIDEDKIGALSKAVNEAARAKRDRKTYTQRMSNVLTEGVIAEYIEDFDMFVENSRNLTKTISENRLKEQRIRAKEQSEQKSDDLAGKNGEKNTEPRVFEDSVRAANYEGTTQEGDIEQVADRELEAFKGKEEEVHVGEPKVEEQVEVSDLEMDKAFELSQQSITVNKVQPNKIGETKLEEKAVSSQEFDEKVQESVIAIVGESKPVIPEEIYKEQNKNSQRAQEIQQQISPQEEQQNLAFEEKIEEEQAEPEKKNFVDVVRDAVSSVYNGFMNKLRGRKLLGAGKKEETGVNVKFKLDDKKEENETSLGVDTKQGIDIFRVSEEIIKKTQAVGMSFLNNHMQHNPIQSSKGDDQEHGDESK